MSGSAPAAPRDVTALSASGIEGEMPTRIYLLALGITLATELPVAWLGFRAPLRRHGAGLARLALVFVVTHLFSHGTLWWTWQLLPGTYAIKLLVGETGVWLVEAACYRLFLPGVSAPRALLVSAVANVISTAIGLAVWRLTLP
jgi:hypothetical protein